MSGFKRRSGTAGRSRFIMNVEELATIWHFPIEAAVKAPLVQKTPGRKSEPPMSLPVGGEAVGETFFDHDPTLSVGKQVGSAFAKESEKEPAEESKIKSLPWDEPMEKISVDPVNSEEEEANKKKAGAPPENLPFA